MTAKGGKLSFKCLFRHWIQGNLDFELNKVECHTGTFEEKH